MHPQRFERWPILGPRYDRETPAQYGFWANALLRRQHMELVENPWNKDFVHQAIEEGITDKQGLFLDIGCGSGIDILDVVDPLRIGYEGQVVGLEVPLKKSFVPFADRFDTLALNLASVGKGLQVIEDTRPRDKLRELESSPDTVAIIKGMAQNIPLPDGAARYVLAANSLQHAPGALPEIWRVLEPGGTLIIVTNAAGNKARFHRALSSMAREMSKRGRTTYPGPLSSKFSYEIGLQRVPQNGFTITHTKELVDNYVYREEDIPLLLDVADTYRSVFTRDIRDGRPISDGEWKLARFIYLEDRLLEEIGASPEHVSREPAHRGAIIARKPL